MTRENARPWEQGVPVAFFASGRGLVRDGGPRGSLSRNEIEPATMPTDPDRMIFRH